MEQKENINPNIFQKISERETTTEEEDDNIIDDFDTREIFGKNELFVEIKFCPFLT